jgi:hypothetical protein
VNRNGELGENSTEPRLESCSWRRAWNRADPEATSAHVLARGGGSAIASERSRRPSRRLVVSSVFRRSIGQVDRAGSRLDRAGRVVVGQETVGRCRTVGRSFLGESERVPKGEKRTRLELRSAWRTSDREGTWDEEGGHWTASAIGGQRSPAFVGMCPLRVRVETIHGRYMRARARTRACVRACCHATCTPRMETLRVQSSWRAS